MRKKSPNRVLYRILPSQQIFLWLYHHWKQYVVVCEKGRRDNILIIMEHQPSQFICTWVISAARQTQLIVGRLAISLMMSRLRSDQSCPSRFFATLPPAFEIELQNPKISPKRQFVTYKYIFKNKIWKREWPTTLGVRIGFHRIIFFFFIWWKGCRRRLVNYFSEIL